MSQDTPALFAHVTFARSLVMSPITARRPENRKREAEELEALLTGIQLLVALFLIPSQLERGENNRDLRVVQIQTSWQAVVSKLQLLLVKIDRLVPSQTHREDHTHSTHTLMIPASCLKER
jgi:hypothetical protein